MQDAVERVSNAIIKQTELVIGSDAFQAWDQRLSLQPGDLVICNNSFLYREASRSVKNAKYLAIPISESGEPVPQPCVVTPLKRLLVQFRRVPHRERPQYLTASIRDAVRAELAHVGTIVLVLVGRVGEVEIAEVDFDALPGLRALRYVPSQTVIAHVAGDCLAISRLDDLDAVWAAVTKVLDEADIDASQAAEAFEKEFQNLQEAAARPVDIADISMTGPTILGSVVDRMEKQVGDFSDFLRLHGEAPADNEGYNELLRVAYNFAEGARSFLSLMVGICDLKPVIFWLTISDQIGLASRFSQLPFALVGGAKPSLTRYRSVISGARNRAFHDLYGFDHPFSAALGEGSLRGAELRLFRDYNSSGPALTFEDRELVELFQGLTRASQRPVPLGFWEKNVSVMTSVTGVARALREALILVAGPTADRS
ncbi:MAG: hypothetical protein ACLPUG_09790 [Acidimicrobiales bacterium]|jgi:hypothetical protein